MIQYNVHTDIEQKTTCNFFSSFCLALNDVLYCTYKSLRIAYGMQICGITGRFTGLEVNIVYSELPEVLRMGVLFSQECYSMPQKLSSRDKTYVCVNVR